MLLAAASPAYKRKGPDGVFHFIHSFVALNDRVGNGDSTISINNLVRVLVTACERLVVRANTSFVIGCVTVGFCDVGSCLDIDNLEPLLHHIFVDDLWCF